MDMSNLSFIEQVDIIARQNGYKLKEAHKGAWTTNVYCYFKKPNWIVWAVKNTCDDDIPPFSEWKVSNDAEKDHIVKVWSED